MNKVTDPNLNQYPETYDQKEEMELIGCLMNNPEIIERLDNFTVDHFYLPISKSIYNIIASLHANGQAMSREGILRELISTMGIKDDKAKNKIGLFLLNCFHASATAHNPVGVANSLIDLSIKRSLVDFAKQIITDSTQPKYTASALTLLEKAEESLFKIAMHGHNEKSVCDFDTLMSNNLVTLCRKYQNKDKLHGVTTGLVDLDKKLNGFQNSDLVILAARPAMGKTALAINMAVEGAKALANTNKSVLFFSLEMSAEQLGDRMLAMGTGINAFKLRAGNVNQKDYDEIIRWTQRTSGLPLFIDDTAAMTMSVIRSRARKYVRKHNLGAIFIDYLQLIQTPIVRTNDTRVNELSSITRDLKQLAKELNVPVIVLSQLSRYVEHREDKRPMLSDLRESGSIEQDADIVMFIYRDEYYKMRTQPKMGTPEHDEWVREMDSIMNKAEIIISKHRNGPIGTVEVMFDPNTTTFKNIANPAVIERIDC